MKRDNIATEQIDTITLEGVLPRVFLNESIPPSDVWNSTLVFERGHFYNVEARSGGGKSSLCAFLYGTRSDYEGKILFDDTDARSISIAEWQELRQWRLAYVPQELGLFPELTALENIRLKNNLTNCQTEKRIEEWLQRLGIDSRSHYPVGRMSVGQQQRVALIRALCQPFNFLLLDEPVSHLDRENNRIAAEIIMEEARSLDAAVIATSVGNPLLLEYPEPVRL